MSGALKQSEVFSKLYTATGKVKKMQLAPDAYIMKKPRFTKTLSPVPHLMYKYE
jgi:hypothetical protein